MIPEEAERLRAPFPPSVIGKLPKPTKKENPKGRCDECGGYHGLPAIHLDYVGHAATTDRLLQVDPEWSWEPFALDEHGLPALDREGNLWIRLTVCGVTRPGVGDGDTHKERIGDAIRNAAMRFGVALDLWAKEDLGVNGKPDEAESIMERQKKRIQKRVAHEEPPLEETARPDPPTITPAQQKKMWATIREHGISEARARELMQQVCGPLEHSNEIPRDLFDAVLTVLQAEDVLA